jgi:hypothetical protein
MMTLMRTTIALLLMLPFAATQAQEDFTDEVPEIRRYTVEMIIFRYAQAVSVGTEIFPGDKPMVEDPGFDQEPLLAEDEPLEEIPRFYRSIDFAPLAKDEYTMRDILRRLQRLDVYEPLMHFGWSQATWPDEETRPIELGNMGTPPKGLNGSLRLYLSRYLHLVVDLQLDAPEARDSMDSLSTYGDYRSLNEYGDIGEPIPVRYQINENRILRSGELRYFDHPKFGVLARVTRVEDAPAETPEDLQDSTETELLGYPAE